ncbi:MAG TPA: TolC family protein, partial [Candidatus Omnitrophota bacterium]|nr:TolC family protein [Candidatus Omnitrophota bacterium]
MIGKNIKKIRRQKDVSQDRLSKLSDLSLNTIVKIESGRNPNPTIKTLSRIADSLNVKVDDLLVVIIFFLAGFIFPCASFSQEEKAPIPAITELSVEAAMEAAYKNNKDIQIQEKELMAAGAEIVGARSQFLPHLNVNAGYTHNGAVTPLKIAGKKDSGIFTGYENDNSAGAGITQMVYDGGASVANLNTSKLNLRVQQETLRAKSLDIEFETKRLYYGLLLAYETERIAQELVERGDDVLV